MKRTALIAVLAAALLVGVVVVAAVNSPMLRDRMTHASTDWSENTTQISRTSAHLVVIRQNDNLSTADEPDVAHRRLDVPYTHIMQSNKSAKIYARPFGNDTDYENIALQYVSETYGTSIEELEVGSKVQRHFCMLDMKVWVMNVHMKKWNLKQGPDPDYEVFINMDGSITDADEFGELKAQDRKAHKEKYGKLRPSLYDRLQSMQPNETIRVIIDVTGIDREGIEKEVISKYPDIEIINYTDPLVREKYPDLSTERYPNLFYGFGLTKVMIKDGPLDRVERKGIQQEIRAAKKEAYALKEKPLIDYLTAKGHYTEGADDVATVFSILPKEEIIALQERDDVIMMWRGDIIYEHQINTAVPTIRANEVWSEGFDGTGVKIAIVEPDGVDFSNPHLHGYMRPGQTDVGSHATQCAGVAASDNSTFRGVAYGATILSANADSAHPYDIKKAADWAISEDAAVLSCSVGNDTGLKMDWLDRYFDKVVYEDSRNVVIPSGNSYGNVKSPGLGWNVITVGGIDDGNNADWSDDDIDPQSGYIDPPDADINKPEVCAVSMPIRSTEMEDYFNENGTWITEPPWLYTGTSYAAPAVAGEIALLSQWFIAPPEMFKAVVMASAIHNAYGDKIDDKEGVGTVDVLEGCKILYGYGEPHAGMFTIPATTNYTAYFNAVEGEKVRFVICWCSHTNWTVNESYDLLESNFDINIYDPQTNRVGNSKSKDNSYEVVDFTAPITGEYEARISRVGCGEDEDVGCAWSRIFPHDWHMLSHDPQRSGRSALKGDLSGTMHYTTIFDSDKLAHPAVADIDGDGKQEIVVSNEDTICAFEGNGDHIWTYTGITDAQNAPTIWDVDDDGGQEVVVETHNSKLYILDAATGDYEWEYATEDIVVSPPIVFDVDGDGKQEIVFGDGYYLSEDRHIYALNGDTRDELWKVTSGGHNIWQAMADVDSDGKQEIIGVNANGVFALNAESGSILWQKEYRNAVCLPAIADLDDDGELEIAFGTWYFEGFGGANRSYVINAATGDLEWYYDLDDWPGQSSVGDVDGDGVIEIVFNTLNQDIYCLDRYEAWSYPRDGNGAIGDDYYTISAVAIADMDNDDNLEIIVGSTEGYLDIIGGSGSLEKRYDLGGIIEDPVVGDVDDDGKAEIVVKNGIIGLQSSPLGDGDGNGVIYAETSPQKADIDVIHAKTEIFKPDNRSSPSKTSSGVIWYNHVPIVMNASINATDIITNAGYASDFESNAVLVLSGPDPDLVIATSDISFDPVSPTTADIITITATVHNQRDDSFTNKPFKVSFYDEENLIGDDLIVESIPPAGEVNASVEWYCPDSGMHNISVIVDSGYLIPETDETNNEAEKEVVVVLATTHIMDAMLALQMAAGSSPTDPAADVNSDGAVTSLDALLILQYCKTQ